MEFYNLVLCKFMLRRNQTITAISLLDFVMQLRRRITQLKFVFKMHVCLIVIIQLILTIEHQSIQLPNSDEKLFLDTHLSCITGANE